MQHGHVEPPKHGHWKDKIAGVEEKIDAGGYKPSYDWVPTGAVDAFVPAVGGRFTEAECFDNDTHAVACRHAEQHKAQKAKPFARENL